MKLDYDLAAWVVFAISIELNPKPQISLILKANASVQLRDFNAESNTFQLEFRLSGNKPRPDYRAE